MTKREAALKSAFFKELTLQLPNFYALSHATRAAPDRAIHGAGHVSTWEFKHATPDFKVPGDQLLMCIRLAVANHCRFVIWWENGLGEGKRTMIVHPRMIHDGTMVPDTATAGFNHKWLVEQVKKQHGIRF